MIFIHGITQRSGTNYLLTLLAKHPQTSLTESELWENHVLDEIHFLEKYINQTSKRWNPKWLKNTEILKNALSDGLKQFLKQKKSDKIFISKSPSTQNIARFFDFFPNEKLLIIIRDGRNTIESGIKSRGWDFEIALQNWNKSAKRILKLKAEKKDFYLVKYETLFQNPEQEMMNILNYCSLDSSLYDFDLIENHLVYGSSESENLNWKGNEKNVDFDPMNRAKNWSKWKNYRFEFVCGKSAKALNYPSIIQSKSLLYYLYNYIINIISFPKKSILNLKREIKSRFCL